MSDCDFLHGDKERRKSCQHAEEAAEKAVKKMFAILGVDVDKPKDVEEFRQSLRFGDRLRKAADKGILVFVGIFAAAIAGALWIGIIEKIRERLTP